MAYLMDDTIMNNIKFDLGMMECFSDYTIHNTIYSCCMFVWKEGHFECHIGNNNNMYRINKIFI